ncbi:MAG: NAD(P)H-quinone oxidoreductase subunit M [Gloeomargarita sp. HHBFW_bins_162]
MLLKSTTRHIRIFAATVQDGTLVPNDTELTVDVDPDNEFNWTDATVAKVHEKFAELVQAYKGADLTDYTLRRIGSDLEHFIRGMLQRGEISYNVNSRVLNYSMGRPRLDTTQEN